MTQLRLILLVFWSRKSRNYFCQEKKVEQAASCYNKKMLAVARQTKQNELDPLVAANGRHICKE